MIIKVLLNILLSKEDVHYYENEIKLKRQRGKRKAGVTEEANLNVTRKQLINGGW